MRAAFGVDHHVRDEWVVARFGEGELDEPALCGLEAKALCPASSACPAPQQVGALGVGGVELTADHVE